MEYEVEREEELKRWHVREKGQTTRGTTVTDAWLDQMGFGRLTRLNIDAVVNATMASAGGIVLDTHAARHMPKDIAFRPSFRSYPSEGRGTKPRNRPHVPDRMLFRSK